jgi:PKD repeat protein
MENQEGNAAVVVKKAALSASDVSKVEVSVTASDISPAMQKQLVLSQGKWSGTIQSIPVGSNRTFTAVAYDAAGKSLFEGSAQNVAIAGGKTASVLIVLQQKDQDAPYENQVPWIDALVASPAQVEPNEKVSLKVTAHDKDAGDTITYNWVVSGGTLDNSTAAETTWSAAQAGTYRVTLTVSDSKGASIVVSTELVVTLPSTGDAKINAEFNVWPKLSMVSASPGRIEANGRVSLMAIASDSDNDSLTYSWTAAGTGCVGSFDDATSRSPLWVAPLNAPASGTCDLHVTVKDGRGGLHKGHVRIQVGPKLKFAATKADKTAPSTAIDMPDGMLPVFASLNLTCYDAGSGCKRIVYTIDGTTPSFNPPNGIIVNGSTATISNYSTMPYDQVRVRFASEDNAGNIEAVKESNYTILP